MLKELQAEDWPRNHFEHAGQSWDCSQVESEPVETDAVDWLMDDEMMRQWEDESEDEEEITVKRSKGRRLQVEKVQRAPGFVMAQAQMEREEGGEQGKAEEDSRLVHKGAGGGCKQARARGQ